MENSDGKVNEKVVKKLSVEPPREELVVGYLEEIAKAYGVDWPKRETVPPPELLDTNDEEEDDDDDSSGGKEQKVLADAFSTPSKTLTEESRAAFQKLGGPTSPLTVTPPRMTTDNVHPKVTLGKVELKPAVTAKKSEPGDTIPDISDLERRFAALKKR